MSDRHVKTIEEIEWEDEWRRKLEEIDDACLHIGDDLKPRHEPKNGLSGATIKTVLTQQGLQPHAGKTDATDLFTYRGVIDFVLVNGKKWRFVLTTFNETVEVMTDKLAERTVKLYGESIIIPRFVWRNHAEERVPALEWYEASGYHWAALTPDAYAMWFDYGIREKALRG